MRWLLVVLFLVHSLEILSLENSHALARYPKKLSDWGIFHLEKRQWSLAEEVHPYELVNPLFTDYAEKFRTLRIPEGKVIQFQEDGTLFFPDGTVLTKTFAYKKEDLDFESEAARQSSPENKGLFEGLHLIETRVLYKEKGQWKALPYVWGASQEEAKLALIGKSFSLNLRHDEIFEASFTYYVPNRNQCISCHMDSEGEEKVFRPIGAKIARNLDRPSSWSINGSNQLELLVDKGLLRGLPPESQRESVVSWSDEGASLEQRARAYLDINCAHCHNPKGSGSTSGLYLNLRNTNLRSLGFCKKPVASGNGSEGAPFDITPGEPLKSILLLRMKSNDPSVMMPELGRSLVHRKGVQLVSDWILGLSTSCESSQEY